MTPKTFPRAILALLLLCLAMTLVVSPALADHHETGYLADFAKDFDGASKKLVDLANATPADKFGWGPTDEVRTIAQAYVHTALANFFLASALGVDMPEGVGQDAEQTVTAKDDVIALLETSQEHVRKAIEMADAATLDEEVEVFGGKRSRRGVFMIIAGHNHEHLGQSIAYARSAGVVPPWSQPNS